MSKPFDLEAAKAGKKLQTSDGRSVRIVCFDRANTSGGAIVALISEVHSGQKVEIMYTYCEDGTYCSSFNRKNDLVMAPEIREYWVNVYRNKHGVSTTGTYQTKAAAYSERLGSNYVDTILLYKEEI